MLTTAVILAAGVGRRLGSRAGGLPKALVPVAGEPIAARLVRQLAACGVTRVVVVVGDRAEMIRAALGSGPPGVAVGFVESVDHATTNNSVSLLLAADELRAGCLLLEGDVVAEDGILRRLATGDDAAWLVRPFEAGMDGALLEGTPGGPVERLRIVPRGEPAPAAGFKSLGLLRIDAAFGAALADWLARECAVRRDRYYDLVVADHLAERAPRLEVVQGRWIEIDTPEDLDAAHALFEGR
jgi:choline kinase